MRLMNYLEGTINNKFKALVILSLALATTACSSDDNYVSVRHPQGESQQEVTDESLEENPNEDSKKNTDTANDQLEETTDNPQNTDNDSDGGDGVMYTVENVVNVRVAPSESSNVMTTVESGDEILKLGESDDWSRISIDGQTGYIRSDLLVEK